ncbi:type I secretion system permease/ATPase [Anianabacter salinae]|uniref:type I secretion system permease/ATPase n=1 Tax=Anianabacter salinae TaxID=2851023 RepID=UPI00225E4261|nr:ATP-binding cassette domain-containing protein [Anianabacter salinae]
MDDGTGSRGEVWQAVRPALPLLVAAGWLSVIGNLLMLTGPVYMIEVYDRALPAGSVETLVALTGLMLFLYMVMTIADIARAQLLVRAGARVEAGLAARCFDAGMTQARLGLGAAPAARPLDDLEALAAVFSAPVATVVFDLPFTLLFALMLFWIDPALGMLATFGAALLIAVTVQRRAMLGRAEIEAEALRLRARAGHDALAADPDSAWGAGLIAPGRAEWSRDLARARIARARVDDAAAVFGSLSRTLRLGLQAAALGLGAWLAIRSEISPGVIFAIALFLGRSLAPVETLVQGWPTAARALRGWERLGRTLAATPDLEGARPGVRDAPASLVAADLWTGPPGMPLVRGVDLQVAPGEVLGLIGPSGSGKSALLRGLAGVWPPQHGSVRLGNGPTGSAGYLPQTLRAHPVSIARFIARLAEEPEIGAVTEAALAAGLHDAIQRLPGGYDTILGAAGEPLPGGQLRRLGLARALCGQPAVLLLDEPEAHADGAGISAILSAIQTARWWGAATVVAAHRPEIIALCDRLICLEAGRVRLAGLRAEVLEALARAPSASARSA